jgi:hypothetical protein
MIAMNLLCFHLWCLARLCLFGALLFSLSAQQYIEAAPPGESVPQRIVELLEENAKSTSALTVEYNVVRSSLLGLQEFLRTIKQPERKEIFQPNSYRLILQSDKWHYYYNVWMTDAHGASRTNENLTVFDGTTGYGSSLQAQPRIGIYSPKYFDNQAPLHSLFGYKDFVVDAGFSASKSSVSSWRPLESSALQAIGEGAEVLSVKGDAAADVGDFEIILANSSGRFRYVLDLAKHGAVRILQDMTPAGQVRYSTENSRFTLLPNTSLWLPQFCRMTCYTWPTIPDVVRTQPIAFEDVAVTAIHNRPAPDDAFVIDWKQPGSIVGDTRITEDGAKASYIVPADPQYLDEVIAAAARGEEFIVPLGNRAGRVWWLIALNCVVFAALAALYIARRRRALQ